MPQGCELPKELVSQESHLDESRLHI
jgi:hypothetical protein